MATFPALSPVSRKYGLGVYPVTTESGFGGGSVRFLHSGRCSGHTMELAFENLTQAEAALIRDHYRTQNGGTFAFQLSSAAWAGNTMTSNLGDQPMVWRYASEPKESQKSAGFVDVTVNLVSVY